MDAMNITKLTKERMKETTYMCSKVYNMLRRKDLLDNHKQQRDADQWSRYDRDNYIVTMILNEDVDPIKICEELKGDNVFLWLIDGLQRVTYIKNFKDGVFKLGRNLKPHSVIYSEAVLDEDGNVDSYRDVEFDLRGKSYLQLPEQIKERFNNCPVKIVKHLDCTAEEMGRHIERYNAGKEMNPAQRLLTYMPNTAGEIKKLSHHDFWNDIANYSASKDKNGSINKVVSEIMTLINFPDSWTKNMNKMGELIEEKATREMFSKLENQMDRLLNVVSIENGELFAPKSALIFFKLFDKFTTIDANDQHFGDFLADIDSWGNKKFEVENEYELEKGSGITTKMISFNQLNALKSTKDRGVLNDKLHILEMAMGEYLHNLNVEYENRVEEKTQTEENESSVAADTGVSADEVNVDAAVTEETTDNTIDIPDDADDVLSFIQHNIGEGITEEDVELFDMVANEKSEALDIDSWILADENRSPYVGLVAYAVINDNEKCLTDWLPEYEKAEPETDNKHDLFINMKNNFDSFVAAAMTNSDDTNRLSA